MTLMEKGPTPANTNLLNAKRQRMMSSILAMRILKLRLWSIKNNFKIKLYIYLVIALKVIFGHFLLIIFSHLALKN